MLRNAALNDKASRDCYCQARVSFNAMYFFFDLSDDFSFSLTKWLSSPILYNVPYLLRNLGNAC